MPRIVHVTNSASREIVDGGINREEGLAAFLAARGAKRLIVQDGGFSSSKAGRLLRLPRLMRELRQSGADVVVLNYPSYPFYWRHKVTPYFLISLMFCRALRRLADRSGFRVVIDVMDLPAFQHEDLGFRLEMRPSTLKRFDRFIFRRADRLWLCSHQLSALVMREYDLPEGNVTTVVNGSAITATRRQARNGEPFRFVCSGGLRKERGTADLIGTFIRAEIPNAELHLAGCGGEWIPEQFDRPDVIYHGPLSDEASARVVGDCDVGLIYYPQTGYYHLAFATKLAHYVCCGLPVLCTAVDETGNAVRQMGVGRVADISDFGEAMRELAASRSGLERYRSPLQEAARTLTWDHLYSEGFAKIGL